ncbi:MAG: hypothetical protein M3Q96_07520 [Pseudomonadota bacterium]|nr:hypothetical protein [Pseudomonadota bacterium]
MIRTTLSLAALAAGIAMSGQAEAVTVNRDYLTHGAASCQAALPVFDTNIRKRPKAVANEGSSSAFVTCGFDEINNAGTGYSDVNVFFINRSGVAKTVNCTFVDGIFDTVITPSIVKSVVMPTTASPTALGVNAATDNAGNNFTAPAISCELPPGVEIGAVRGVFPEEVGA